MERSKGSGGAPGGAGNWGGERDGPEAPDVLYNAFASSDEDSEDERRAPFGRKRIGGSSHSRKSGTAGAPPASDAPVSAEAAASAQGGRGGGSSNTVAGGGAPWASVSSDRGDSGSGCGSGSGSGGECKRSVASREASRANYDAPEEGDGEGSAEDSSAAEHKEDRDDSSSAISGALAAGDTDLEDDPAAAPGAEEGQQVVDDAERAAVGDGAGATAFKHGGNIDLTQSDDEEQEEQEEEGVRTSCPLCGKSFSLTEIDTHANACLDDGTAIDPAKGPRAERAGSGSGDGRGGGGESGSSGGAGSGSSGGIGSGGASSPPSGSTLDATGGGSSVECKGECWVCKKLFLYTELEAHMNACLDKQAREEEEQEKKIKRAKRWVCGWVGRCVGWWVERAGVVAVGFRVTVLGFGTRGLSTASARHSQRTKTNLCPLAVMCAAHLSSKQRPSQR